MNSLDELGVRELVGQEVDDRIRAVVRETVKEAVAETLKQIGIDLEQPTDRQEDFAYLRKLRRGSELVKATCITTCAGAFITAIIYLIPLGIREWWKTKL